jgi:hypothetical protein
MKDTTRRRKRAILGMNLSPEIEIRKFDAFILPEATAMA